MKTLITLTAIVVLMTATVFANGNDQKTELKSPTTEVQILQLDQEHLNVRFEKASDEVLTLRLKSANGATLYKKVFRDNNLVSTTFDLSDFPWGEYLVEVKGKEKVYKEVFNR